jgi:fatty-acyl-CoA synthase
MRVTGWSAFARGTGVLHAARVLHRAGLVRFARPDLVARAQRDVHRWGPLPAAIRIATRLDAEAIGLVDDRGALTFGELDRRSDALCAAWRSRGYRERDVIAILCRDHRGMADALFAGGKLGARLVLMNTGFSGPQLTDVARREGVSLIVYDQEFASAVAHLPPSLPRFGTLPNASEGESLEDLVTTAVRPVPPPSTHSTVVLLTSGTTGLPKGAPRQVRSSIVSAQLLDRIPLRARESTFIAAPLFHGTGLANFIVAVTLASTTVLTRRFDAEAVVAEVARQRCTALMLVPTMLRRIVDLGDDTLARYDLSRLRIIFSAGSSLSPDLVARTTRTFGHILYNLYGSTEVAVATVARPDDLRLAPGTAGRPPYGCRVRLYDDHGAPVTAPGVTGRIFVSNGLKFAGYTDGSGKEAIDGLVSTGDVGHVDEQGLLYVDGRDDDMVISGGENVFPGEIEDLLSAHPHIVECCVVGVPDDEFGQRLRAFAVLEPGASLGADEIKAYVRGNLARHKVPRDVVFVDALPRTPTGKVLRRLLHESSGLDADAG